MSNALEIRIKITRKICDPSLFWSLTNISALDKTSESPVNVIVIALLRRPSTLWLASSTKYPMFLHSMHKNLWRKSNLFSTAKSIWSLTRSAFMLFLYQFVTFVSIQFKSISATMGRSWNTEHIICPNR